MGKGNNPVDLRGNNPVNFDFFFFKKSFIPIICTRKATLIRGIVNLVDYFHSIKN